MEESAQIDTPRQVEFDQKNFVERFLRGDPAAITVAYGRIADKQWFTSLIFDPDDPDDRVLELPNGAENKVKIIYGAVKKYLPGADVLFEHKPQDIPTKPNSIFVERASDLFNYFSAVQTL